MDTEENETYHTSKNKGTDIEEEKESLRKDDTVCSK
jgi:hypothetical protein